MKKLLFAMAALIALAACNFNRLYIETRSAAEEVAFEEAKNYFFKNDQTIPASPKITSEEEFHKLFGMATTMGKDGKPTPIDFSRQFVLAIVHPVTDVATEIVPVKVMVKRDTLFYDYELKVGEKQSFSIQPVSIIILDKKYSNREVVLSSLTAPKE